MSQKGGDDDDDQILRLFLTRRCGRQKSFLLSGSLPPLFEVCGDEKHVPHKILKCKIQFLLQWSVIRVRRRRRETFILPFYVTKLRKTFSSLFSLPDGGGGWVESSFWVLTFLTCSCVDVDVIYASVISDVLHGSRINFTSQCHQRATRHDMSPQLISTNSNKGKSKVLKIPLLTLMPPWSREEQIEK